MLLTTSTVAALLACCSVVTGASTKARQPHPQIVYVQQAPPQHYGVVNPLSYNSYNPSVPTFYNPASSYSPPVYNTAYNPSGYNPAINYNPYMTPPQQFYYGNSPGLRPQFVFVYPGYGGQVPSHVPGQVPSHVPGQVPSHGQVPTYVPAHIPGQVPVPAAPPTDDTGDAETIGVTAGEDDSAEREPLIPGVALSGPETGKRAGMPEKHVIAESPIHRIVQQPSLPTKAAVQYRPVQAFKRAAVKAEDATLQSRMGSASDSETRAAAEYEGRVLRAESMGWRRRLAPSLQSVYLDADDEENDDKKKPGKEEADSVVVGNNEPPAGPSVASVKPAAIALAGPGGVASASPVGTAVVGPGGLAVAAPSATAVAGPSGGVPPGALGAGGASARSNLRLHQILETLYGKPARQVAFRTTDLAFDDDYEQ